MQNDNLHKLVKNVVLSEDAKSSDVVHSYCDAGRMALEYAFYAGAVNNFTLLLNSLVLDKLEPRVTRFENAVHLGIEATSDIVVEMSELLASKVEKDVELKSSLLRLFQSQFYQYLKRTDSAGIKLYNVFQKHTLEFLSEKGSSVTGILTLLLDFKWLWDSQESLVRVFSYHHQKDVLNLANRKWTKQELKLLRQVVRKACLERYFDLVMVMLGLVSQEEDVVEMLECVAGSVTNEGGIPEILKTKLEDHFVIVDTLTREKFEDIFYLVCEKTTPRVLKNRANLQFLARLKQAKQK